MSGRYLEFIADDPRGLWAAGDRCEDLGWESVLPEGHPRFLPVRLLKFRGEVIALTDPISRGTLRVIPDLEAELRETATVHRPQDA